MKTKHKLFLAVAIGTASVIPGLATAQESLSKSLTVTATNDPMNNMIQVYDTSTHGLLQTLATGGRGGVGGNARGVRQYAGKVFAVVNNGSNTVTIFERKGNQLVLTSTVTTKSPPASIDFSADHMYVAGDTAVESFPLRGNKVLKSDGSADLILAGGAIPTHGETAQVGVAGMQILVTLKTDPTPGTVDVIGLDKKGAITGLAMAVGAPSQSLTPFGFSVLDDGTALITLAHSGEVGLFRNGAFASVINSGGQGGPCWTTLIGKYVMIVNAGSKTVTREVSTGSNIFIDAVVAAPIVTGGNPTDTDSNGDAQVVLDHSGTSHLTFFKVNGFGELTPDGNPIDLGVPGANGVAVMGPTN